MCANRLCTPVIWDIGFKNDVHVQHLRFINDNVLCFYRAFYLYSALYEYVCFCLSSEEAAPDLGVGVETADSAALSAESNFSLLTMDDSQEYDWKLPFSEEAAITSDPIDPIDGD